MSEFSVEVVQLGKIGKHPNADSLSITQVKGRYPVVLKTGEFESGDLAVHIPPDAIVDTTREEFSWLADQAKNDRFRVRFRKLRGIPSYGFFLQVPRHAGWTPGQVVQGYFGVEKYEDDSTDGLGYQHKASSILPVYDIQGLRKYSDLFQENESVIVTEKIHGRNGRWIKYQGDLVSASRKRLTQGSIWNQMAEKYALDQLPEGIAVYGEVYGKGMQDLSYGVYAEPKVAFFDVFDSNNGVWYKPLDFFDFCAKYDLPTVPLVYDGPYNLDLMLELAEGETILGEGVHVREGVVVKPISERWDNSIGRVFLKLVGEGYLTRKED